MYLRLNKDKSKNYIAPSKLPFNENVLIFSPHPDDDVIGMGGFIYQLSKNNNVNIFYCTSGYKGVSFDYIKNKKWDKKGIGYSIKKNSIIASEIRKKEAIKAVKTLGINEKNIKFLDLPFYDKKDFGKRNLDILSNSFKNTKFDLIYICTDFGDPHGTHYKCFKIIKKFLKKTKVNFKNILFYKNIWEEFSYNDIDYVFCFGDYVINKKIMAIKLHNSQLFPFYPGKDKVPFWEKAKLFNKKNTLFFEKIKDCKYMEFFGKLNF